nr:RNA-directed DNA polymerase, eukaryota [Tanacetum cinerariifolium]
LDRGEGIDTDVTRRSDVVRILQDIEKTEAMEVAQKAKIKWAVEGDENSKHYHGVINKKRNNLDIRGVLVDGNWVESPQLVKNEFYAHFKQRFEKPNLSGIQFDREFPNKICSKQAVDLEREVSKEEVKRAVWDCGIDKAPGPDGFTFGFYRRFWNLIECDVVKAVKWFFLHERIPSGGNSSFITLIPKVSNANMVKDFRPISLIGIVYKIVAKILANRLVLVLGDLSGGCWIIFGNQDSSMSVSHLFYADDAIFMGQWNQSNIDTIVRVLKVFHSASGLRINMKKSKLMGIAVDASRVEQAIRQIGCMALKIPFKYLGSVVRDRMSRVKSWNDVIDTLVATKLSHVDLEWSFRRKSRGGAEQIQMTILKELLEGCILSDTKDRWTWSLEGSGEFSVSSIWKTIDAAFLLCVVTWWSSHFGMTWHATSMWQITTPLKGPLQLAHVELKYMKALCNSWQLMKHITISTLTFLTSKNSTNNLNPPLEISKESFSNPEDEKSRNKFAIAALLQQNPESYRQEIGTTLPAVNAIRRYSFKAAISDETGTGYFTFFTPDILTGIYCPKLVSQQDAQVLRDFPVEILKLNGQQHIFQFHYSPHCEKGKVEFYFDTILDKPLQIVGSSEQAENITDKEPSVIAIEMPKPVSAEICVSLPTSTCEPSSQLITASPTMIVESGNTPTQTEKKTLGSPKEMAVEVLEYPRTQASKKETSMETPKKTSKRPLFPKTQDDPK